ncbi:MAG: type IV secretion protein IcmB, partial [Bdellovibrionales bacterium]
MFDFFDDTIATLMTSLRQPIESFIQLETADDDITLVASDGSLVSIVKQFGARQIIGDAEYQWIIDQATMKLGSRFDRPGYAMQVYFMRDPSMAGQDIDEVINNNRAAMRASELELNDLLDERRRHLANYMAHEEIYFVLWTRPSVLTKTELEATIKQRGTKKWVKAPDAQYPMQALEALRTRHKSYVSSVASSLEE